MNFLRKYLNDIKPNFEPEGKLHAFRSLFDGFETFLFVPNQTSKTGVSIHDAIDSKRIMSFVVIALLPALLFGMYNVGFQNYKAAGALADASFFSMFLYGALQVLPKIIVSYVVGLGIEFAWAQWKGEEIQEGFLVSGIIIPLIIPVGCPLWALASTWRSSHARSSSSHILQRCQAMQYGWLTTHSSVLATLCLIPSPAPLRSAR